MRLLRLDNPPQQTAATRHLTRRPYVLTTNLSSYTPYQALVFDGVHLSTTPALRVHLLRSSTCTAAGNSSQVLLFRPFASTFYEVLPGSPPETAAKHSYSGPSRLPSTKFYLYRRRKLQPSTPVPTLRVHLIRSTTCIVAGNCSQALLPWPFASTLYNVLRVPPPETPAKHSSINSAPKGNQAHDHAPAHHQVSKGAVVVATVQYDNEYLVTLRVDSLL